MAAAGERAATSADRIAEAHARLLQDSSVQFAFSESAPSRPVDLGWLEALGRLLAEAAPAMSYVVWGCLIGAGVLMAWLVGREMLGVRWRQRAEAPTASADTAPWRPAAAQARVLLEDADRLADEGRYAEAAHLLLLRTIGHIEGRRPDLVRPALTSRDIASLDALPEAARPAFASIAQVVERSLFGGRPVDADAFGRCRRAYAQFALPAAWT